MIGYGKGGFPKAYYINVYKQTPSILEGVLFMSFYHWG